jgi:CheY-like chemotaxis protein
VLPPAFVTDFVIFAGASSACERGRYHADAAVFVRPGATLSTILVVDNDRDIRSLLRLILEIAGHVVVEAPHGKAALDIIRPSALPDVVITDLMMPVLSGAELIEWLHSEQRTAAIPIVVVSASSDAARTLQASGLVQAVVRKPFDVYALVDCIESVATPSDRSRPDLRQLAV